MPGVRTGVRRTFAAAWRAAVRPATVLGLALVLAGPSRALAAGVLDQVWLGGFIHDVNDLGNGKESNAADIEVEVDTVQPHALRVLGAPHIAATLALDTRGRTNFGGVGLMWDHRLFDRLYGSVQFGVDLTDGVRAPAPGAQGTLERQHRLLLGSKVLFREAAGLDWRLSERWSVGVEYVHLSNGSILARRYNEGVNDAGVRLGYRFR
jgi:hypothetical protein